MMQAALGFKDRITALWPGVLSVVTIALASVFITNNLGGPVMLYALLIGMAFHFLMTETRAADGVQFCAKTILRVGVALLGVRLTLSDVTDLGWHIALLVVGGVAVSIWVGAWLGRRMGLDRAFAVLSAGAVSICGASAALALSSVLPRTPESQKHTSLTVVAVTSLSTVAMVLYPVILQSLDLDSQTAGIFIGATIHDVAQVVGAGYTISEEAGDTSAVVKLMRVVCLMPVVLLVSIRFRDETTQSGRRPPLVPGFVLAFIGLIIATSLGLIPETVQAALSDTSRWCLVIAVSALGVKTSLGELMKIGPRPALAMVYQTLFLALIVALALMFMTQMMPEA